MSCECSDVLVRLFLVLLVKSALSDSPLCPAPLLSWKVFKYVRNFLHNLAKINKLKSGSFSIRKTLFKLKINSELRSSFKLIYFKYISSNLILNYFCITFGLPLSLWLVCYAIYLCIFGGYYRSEMLCGRHEVLIR